MRTHRREKIDALRNAILNVAIGRAPGEAQQEVFLGYVDSFTAWHITILRFMEGPIAFAAQRGVEINFAIGGALSAVLVRCFPELTGKAEFCDQIVRDLRIRGFINNSDDGVLHVMMSQSGLNDRHTTDLADRFLAFIAAPRELRVERPDRGILINQYAAG
ncbi:hypothetical protein [uncultured Paludibaculum sp.]|uniref:hypothetical protein n=1 Tax=uncultured Paludibaculum sp. TaxID=1765020 RepID=UPI002AAB9697|nr:hypothetical protein [uncultured Paludibaculum sp.]